MVHFIFQKGQNEPSSWRLKVVLEGKAPLTNHYLPVYHILERIMRSGRDPEEFRKKNKRLICF